MPNTHKRPVGLLGCPRGCYSEHTPECVVRREIAYLGQVGALDHLREIADLLGIDIATDPQSYVERESGRRGEGMGAFRSYDEALTVAAGAVGRVTPSQSAALTETLRAAASDALTVRADLVAKCEPDGRPHPVPGRFGWLDVATVIALGQ